MLNNIFSLRLIRSIMRKIMSDDVILNYDHFCHLSISYYPIAYYSSIVKSSICSFNNNNDEELLFDWKKKKICLFFIHAHNKKIWLFDWHITSGLFIIREKLIMTNISCSNKLNLLMFNRIPHSRSLQAITIKHRSRLEIIVTLFSQEFYLIYQS